MFAQSLGDNAPAGPFIVLSTVDSTNNYAMAKLHAAQIEGGSGFLALEQTAGKGQRGRSWQVKPGENITMSVVFRPKGYQPAEFSMAIALSCYDFIKAFKVENVSIKWPNDIYIGDRKAAGILIENILRSGSWEWAIAGVGINLNQQDFGETLNRAVSIASVTRKQYPLVESAKALHRTMTTQVALRRQDLLSRYNDLLYKRDEEIKVRQGNIVFSTRIKAVSADGMLITEDVMERRFAVGEIEFIG